MILDKIAKFFPQQLNTLSAYNKSLYIVDYTNQSRGHKHVRIYAGERPTDIEYFNLANNYNLDLNVIVFDNDSFVDFEGNAESQCECVIFPENADAHSWLCFIELKYCYEVNNGANLKKAHHQLLCSQNYYRAKGIISKSNPCYLFASLPTQSFPFRHSSLSMVDLLRLKREKNIILRNCNRAYVISESLISCSKRLR